MARLDTVEEAAQALDEMRPGWCQLVDTEDLVMQLPLKCVLGQVYGNYYEAPAKLVYTDCYVAGHNKVFRDEEYAQDWISEINSRVAEILRDDGAAPRVAE